MPVIKHGFLRSEENVKLNNFYTQKCIRKYVFIILKEALYIRVNNPSPNRNIGKYHLPHIWNEVLLNIPELKIK